MPRWMCQSYMKLLAIKYTRDDLHQMYILFAACMLKRIPEVQSSINGCCNSAACSSFLTLAATDSWRSSAELTTKQSSNTPWTSFAMHSSEKAAHGIPSKQNQA